LLKLRTVPPYATQSTVALKEKYKIANYKNVLIRIMNTYTC